MSYQCARLKMADISAFHDNFYASRAKLTQDAFILKYCSGNNIKRRRPHQNSRFRNMSVKYTMKLKLSGEIIPVCKNTFLRSLNLSKHRVEGVLRRFKETGLMPVENRGGDRTGGKNDEKKTLVCEFIKSFTVSESHYCRGKTARQYLPAELNIQKICRMFNEVHPDQTVKNCFFRELFTTKFNLGFGSPQTDVCSRCVELAERIKRCGDPEERQTLLTEQRVHKLRANAFFELMREERPDLLCLSYDCQKNLVLPKIPDQQAYYKRQLYLYNFTIVLGSSNSSLSKEKVFAYTWKETDGPKGSNEIASAVFHRLQQLNLDGITEIRLFADGCGGQNKNFTVITMASAWLQRAPQHVKTVELIFPIRGHSFIPPDRVFGNIEKKIRKMSVIVRPEEYYEIFAQHATVLKCGKDWNSFDWKQECSKHIRPTGSLHFKITATKRIIITRNQNNNVIVKGEPYYRNSIGTANGICKKGKSLLNLNPERLGIGNRCVKPEKLRNVEELLTGHFGADWIPNSGALGLQYYREVLERQLECTNQDDKDNNEALCEETDDDNSII